MSQGHSRWAGHSFYGETQTGTAGNYGNFLLPPQRQEFPLSTPALHLLCRRSCMHGFSFLHSDKPQGALLEVLGKEVL